LRWLTLREALRAGAYGSIDTGDIDPEISYDILHLTKANVRTTDMKQGR